MYIYLKILIERIDGWELFYVSTGSKTVPDLILVKILMSDWFYLKDVVKHRQVGIINQFVKT